jgi:hypothetical protein
MRERDGWSKVSKVTSHTVAAVVVTHPPPFSKHSTAQHRDRDPPGQPFAPFGGARTTHHHLCRPQVPEAGPRLKPAGQQTVAGQQKGQQRPGAHAARRIAHTPSARPDSPAVRLATRRVKLLQSLCEPATPASGRLDVSGESLGHCETRPVHFGMTIQSHLRFRTS